ncbi:gene transfer agent family protein [Maritimibacter sp. DP1N21-5]|uniref:gene transfer agent family protein n=1 Tax=Maritimibacter sp. DP1N21-5 TaxID=2836867 RepID=UPI001C45D910|nr:gene transfer agent family protein [Maritimibacter sp. DP1N21-5]MBV7408205.1 gene transfer agent family protein [Maritimibacter sp. DP1N21-5]
MGKGMDPRSRKTFEADGKTWTLQFTTNALVELEEAVGKKIDAFLEAESHSLKDLRTMFWAGLIEHHPEVTQKQAGDIIDAAGGLEAIMGIINGAMTASLPEADAEDGSKGGAVGNGKAAA